MDLSGGFQGTGGIGGLLARTDARGSTFYHSDGNGNITALVNGSQNVVARYLYDPFGRPLGQWGPLADVNKYRFSSKEYDVKAGIYYFGRRFYDPNLQRWLNRDPIGELGGLNLYTYVGNGPINWIDPFGLDAKTYGPITIPLGFPPGTPDAIKQTDQSHEAQHRADFWNGNVFTMQKWQLEQRGFAAEIPILQNALKNPCLSDADRRAIQSELVVATLLSSDETAARYYSGEPYPTTLSIAVPPSMNVSVNTPTAFYPNYHRPYY